MKRLFCLWLPNWPIQRVHAEQLAATEPDGPPGPIILWREDPRRGRVVAACCRRAREAGVHVLLPVAQAAEMVQRSGSQPRLLQHDLNSDDEALRKIAWQIQQKITPLVETETLDEKPWAGFPRHQRESIIGEISGVTHLFGDEHGLLSATHQLMQCLNLHGRIAIADSLGAAWAMAHFGSEADRVGPEQWLIPPLAAPQKLAGLPIESLRIDTQTAETLARLGVEKVHELIQLPKDGLAARLGRQLVRRIEQGLENREEPLGVETAPAEDTAHLELEYPTSDQKILADRVARLVKNLRTGLAARQRGAIRVTCRLDLVIPPPLSIEIGLFAPTVDDEHISSLIVHRLESIRLTADVKRITLAVPLSGPLRTAQRALFETEDCSHSLGGSELSGSEISRMIDSLSGRLGRESVVEVQLLDDPLPENAYRVKPMAGNKGASRKPKARKRRPKPSSRTVEKNPRSSNINKPFSNTNEDRIHEQMVNDLFERNPVNRDPVNRDLINRDLINGGTRSHGPRIPESTFLLPSADDALRRPLCLFPDPIPLSIALPGQAFQKAVSTRQLPEHIRFAGVIHTVLRHWGPEKIETGWWKGPTIRRDYYRIETDRGCWWWIFRNITGTKSRPTYRWMLHGRFD